MADEIVGDSGTSSAAPAASAPASPAGPPASSASAAAPRAQPDDDGSGTAAPQGPIPFDRHKAILEKARKEYEDKYGWAKDYRREDVDLWRDRHERYARAERDPHGFYRDYTAWYQRTFGKPEPTSPAADEPEPQPDARGEDGSPFYTATTLKKLLERQAKQLETRFAERLRPIEERTQRATMQEQVADRAKAVIDDLMSLPHAQELAPRIRDILKSDGRANPRSAYTRAYAEWDAERTTRERKAWADELKQKANASTTNPTSPTTTAPADLRKIADKSGWAAAARVLFNKGGGAS